jgi:N-acetylglucosamine malate deacetylase 1
MVSVEPLNRSVWTYARWLVLAPHPDDETLGAGALIGETAAAGRLAGVTYLTDGTGSHPAGTRGIAAARRSEARTALRRLACRPVAIDWLGWKDSHPHAPSSPVFARDAQRLAARLRRQRIDAIAVSSNADTHCDHVAAYRLAAAAIRLAHRQVDLFCYHVWSSPPLDRARRVRTGASLPGRRRHALRAHRSQLTPAYGKGFRLTHTQQRMTSSDTLILRETMS